MILVFILIALMLGGGGMAVAQSDIVIGFAALMFILTPMLILLGLANGMAEQLINQGTWGILLSQLCFVTLLPGFFVLCVFAAMKSTTDYDGIIIGAACLIGLALALLALILFFGAPIMSIGNKMHLTRNGQPWDHPFAVWVPFALVVLDIIGVVLLRSAIILADKLDMKE